MYDAWGRPISKTGSMASTLGTVQPFRYRGYVYDEETGMLYLRSRYYVPTSQRFLNVDDGLYIELNKLVSTNLSTYCLNDPVTYSDENGHFVMLAVPGWAILQLLHAAPVIHMGVNVANHSYNLGTSLVHDRQLQESYTIDEAKTEIDQILAQYNKDSKVSFAEGDISITNSHYVDSREARQRICQIIARTGVTDREADNLAAEWWGHNVIYDILSGMTVPDDFDFFGMGTRRNLMKRAEHVCLDRVKDDDTIIFLATSLLEINGFE